MEAAAQAATSQMSVLEIMKDKTIRWQLISIVVMQLAQQLCGINAVSCTWRLVVRVLS